jgi:N-acetylmuramoyl-L-alanine amidase
VKVNRFIIHCSDTFPDMVDVGADEIRRWHVDGNGWSDIGYHYVIKRDGTIEKGRDVTVPGAHVAGHNKDSIGICMVGGKARSGRHASNFTRRQWRALDQLVAELFIQFPGATVSGHNDYDSGKKCPQFDAKAWWDDDNSSA